MIYSRLLSGSSMASWMLNQNRVELARDKLCANVHASICIRKSDHHRHHPADQVKAFTTAVAVADNAM
jgi:hypothetical protein